MEKEKSVICAADAAGNISDEKGKNSDRRRNSEEVRNCQKKALTPEISQISVYAPLVAAKAKAGQFIILRVDEEESGFL